MLRQFAVIASVATIGLSSAGMAQEQTDPNLSARKAYMGLLAYNFGVLGGMAQGRMDYDAAMAGTAAANLNALAMVDTSRMWAEGTDTMSIDGTRALPAIWDNMDDFATRWATFRTATDAMATAAGTDLASLQGAIGAIGGSCGGCHEAFRQPQ